jgi:hypothetical protein
LGRFETLSAQCDRTRPSCFGECVRDACERILERLGLRRGTRVLSMRLGAVGILFHLRAGTTAIQRRVLVVGATHAGVQIDELIFIEQGE